MFTFPAALFGVALVEVHKFAGEKGGFIASGTSPNFEKGIAVFGFVFGKERVLNFLR
jgi:phage-related minor tail protein